MLSGSVPGGQTIQDVCCFRPAKFIAQTTSVYVITGRSPLIALQQGTSERRVSIQGFWWTTSRVCCPQQKRASLAKHFDKTGRYICAKQSA